MKPGFSVAIWLGLTCSLFLIGCGGPPKTIKVSGTVTLDGQSLDNAMITFMPVDGGRPATGMIVAGKFSDMSTFAPNDGVVPTSHQIGINPKEPPPMGGFAESDMDGKGNSKSAYTPPFPAKYFTPAGSGLTATVETGRANEFTFELKSK